MFEIYDKLPVCHDVEDAKVRTKDVILAEKIQFSSLLLEEPIQNGLAKCGYKFLSPIQKNALPFVLIGNSVIVHSKSGTGKTLIYLLTALNSYLKYKDEGLFTLILAPTREIAKQVYDVCKNISCFIEGLKVEYFIGGIPLDVDVLKCKTCHIAVGAPGRIKHLIDLGELDIRKLRLLVLDEVDLLINNKEFAISEVVSKLPSSRQNIVCSATYSDEIGTLLKPITPDLQYINMSVEESHENVSSMSNMLLGVKQYVLPVHSDSSVMDSVRKRNKLVDILKNFPYDQCFVFVNYISLVKSVYNFLSKYEMSVLWLSSEQNQSTRVANLNKLKLNECRILVTTDLAARGIDIHNANLVVNLGLPTPPDVYVHRMGRAGRYGSEGSVITIVFEGEELQLFKELVSFVTTEPVNLYVMPSEINAESVNSSLTIINCDPNPDSIVIRELIAKHAAKIESQPVKSQSKKRKQQKTKTESKGKLLERSVPPRIVPGTSTPCSPENDVSESKSMVPHSEELEKRLSDFVDRLQDELDRYKQTTIPLDALEQLAMPKKSTHSRLRFTDYYEIPNTQEECSVSETYTLIHESLLQLADFSRAENSFIDRQRLPLDPYEFFTLIDYDKVINKRNNSTQERELKREVLKTLRDLLGIVVPVKESASDAKNSSALRENSNKLLKPDSRRWSTSTSDSFEPPIKLKPTSSKKGQHIPTVPLNVDLPEYSRNTSPLGNGCPQPLLRSRTSIQFSQQQIPQPSCVPRAPLDYESAQLPDNVSTKRRGNFSTPPQDYESISTGRYVNLRTLNEPERCEPNVAAANDVQCPRCCYRFSVSSNSSNSTSIPLANMLTSLAPYVDLETEREIYESHFNYISSCVERAQFYHPDN